MTYIIAIANQKGGVAKTTTAVSLGGALALLGKEVLMVDLDAQADLTLAMGVEPGRVRHSISDVLLNSASLISTSRETVIPGLDIIPSNAEMELAERFLPIRQNHENILRNIIRNNDALSAYDFVLLDCPPVLGAVTSNALNAAHLLIIPTQPEYFSAHALKNMMVAVRHVRNQGNPELVYRILITMRDRRNRIHRNLSEQLQVTFGIGLFSTVIDTDTKLRESSVAGLPITHYISKSRSAQQYQALAQELTHNVEETVQRTAQPTA